MTLLHPALGEEPPRVEAGEGSSLPRHIHGVMETTETTGLSESGSDTPRLGQGVQVGIGQVPTCGDLWAKPALPTMAWWHNVVADSRAALGLAASLLQDLSVLQLYLTHRATVLSGWDSLAFVSLSPKSTQTLASHLQHEVRHQSKDPWAVRWWQEGRKPLGPRGHTEHAPNAGEQMSFPAQRDSPGALTPELRFHSLRRRSGAYQGLPWQN